MLQNIKEYSYVSPINGDLIMENFNTFIQEIRLESKDIEYILLSIELFNESQPWEPDNKDEVIKIIKSKPIPVNLHNKMSIVKRTVKKNVNL